jgi:hypothetical protein
MKRDSAKKCRPRPTSASPNAVTPTHSVPPSGSSKPASKPAATTTSQPPTYTPSSSSGGSKIILGWSNPEIASIEHFVTDQAQTMFNWALEAASSEILGSSEGVYKSLDYVPSVTNRQGASGLKAAIQGKKPRYIRGFNEPEIPSQANIAVSEAYSLWMEFVAPMANQGIQLLSPAVTTGPAGLQWLDDFMKMCNNKCGISLIDLHFYTVDASFVTNVLKQVHGTHGLNIWITEIGCMDYSGTNQYCDDKTFSSFYSTVMPFVMGNSWIEKIGWFGFFTESQLPNGVNPANAMITCPNGPGADCVPNGLGKAFINAATGF